MLRLVPAALVVSVLAVPAAAAGPFDDLLKYVPPQANTLVLIDVKGAFTSPLAKAENWAARQTGARGGLGFVPPDADAVVIAGEVNLTSMTRDQQFGLVKADRPPTIREIAAKEGGAAGDLGGWLAVLSPRDVYFTTFHGTQLAAVYPANRQAMARWIRQARAAKEPDLAPYLKAAAARTAGATVMVAVDLSDAVDTAAVRAALPFSPAMVKYKDPNLDAIARMAGGVKGVTFTATVGTAITGSVRVDLTGDPKYFKGTTRDLFLELLDDYGAAVPGMENWPAAYTDNSMTLTGPLTPADVRRILSLFAFPQPGGPDDPKHEPTAGPTASATKRYLAAVDAILADVNKLKEGTKPDKVATWYDKAAAQIEHLNRTAADPLAVTFANDAARRLRAIAASLRGVPIDLNALAQSSYVVGARGGWGWRSWLFAPTFVQTNVPQIQGQMAKVVADDQRRRLEAWSQIEQARADLGRKLADKYKGAF